MPDLQLHRVVTSNKSHCVSSPPFELLCISISLFEQKRKYGWEFLFLGANIDAVETARHFGISEDRAVNYHSDSEGTQLNYEVVSEAICAVRCNAPLGADWKKRIDEDYNARKDGRRK